MEQQNKQPWVLVRGAGDLATGVIVRLHRCGFRVVVTECACPSAIRRKAALCEAVWQDTAQVEGVTARRIADAAQAAAVDAAGEIPLIVDEQAACVAALRPAAGGGCDSRQAQSGHKQGYGAYHSRPRAGLYRRAGCGCGDRNHARPHTRSRVVIRQGAALPNTGVPGVIAGYAAERVIHAPDSGAMHFVTDAAGKRIDIGALVRAGQMIARVGNTPVYATIDGVLRGLIRTGYPVTRGLKIADIDPRPEQAAFCDTVSDKARAIGGGVVEALLELARERQIKLL